MRTVYFGTSQFGASVLERLSETAHKPLLVVTRPDRPRGRGRKLLPPPVAELARGLGIELIQPERPNSQGVADRIADLAPDCLCICAYGGLITEPLLSGYPVLNVHPSLLPRWRGAAPIERAIAAGDASTGVTIMRPTKELDAGPICAQRREPIHSDDDAGSLGERLARIGYELLVYSLDQHPAFWEQSAEGATYADKITKEDRLLRKDRSSVALERCVRALSPHIGGYVSLADGKRLTVWSAMPMSNKQPTPSPGEVADVAGRLVFGCADGALELSRVQPQDGRAMDAAEYLHGRGASLRRL
jgi:methionyl-tRNA formyltransferase